MLPDGGTVSVSGTLTGPKQEEKLTEVDGYDVDLRLEGHLLFFRYTDRPGRGRRGRRPARRRGA